MKTPHTPLLPLSVSSENVRTAFCGSFHPDLFDRGLSAGEATAQIKPVSLLAVGIHCEKGHERCHLGIDRIYVRRISPGLPSKKEVCNRN